MNKHTIIVASDSYKDCLSSNEINNAMAAAISQWPENPSVISLEMSDGGEGMLPVFAHALGATLVQMRGHDALMRTIDCAYALAMDTAIIEVAQTVGLQLIEPELRNPMRTTSWGVGEQIMDAYRKGIRKYIVGLGGSSTSDCGIGMLRAMGNDWREVAAQCSFVLASDVTNPLCGHHGAAYVYAAQKGADENMIRGLDERARRFAEASSRALHRDMSREPGAGAAGGLGYAFMQYLGAQMQSGAELLLQFVHFDALLDNAQLVITGEGHSDRQTLMGKLPAVILHHAQSKGIPVWLVSGGISDCDILSHAGFSRILPVTPHDMPLCEAIKVDKAKANILQALSYGRLFGR